VSGLSDLLFAKEPNLVQKITEKEPNPNTKGQKNGQQFFPILAAVTSHMNSYVVIYEMGTLLNHNLSSTTKQVAYMMKDGKRMI